jgi:outer membrane protein OmpA-like peptidoglycan-associated protein
MAQPELPTIYFDTASARIDTPARKRLREISRWLRDSRANLRLRGHSDPRGEDEYNERLSARRAQAVARFLVARGVGASQLETEAIGSAEPAAPGSTPKAWAASRRVELVRVR